MPITVKKTYDPTVALERSNLESRSTLLLQQEGEKKDGPNEREHNGRYPVVVDKLAEWLRVVDPTSAIMQCNGVKKSPLYSHCAESIAAKGLSEWTNESYKSMPPSKDWCILLGDKIMVIDFDTMDVYEEFKERYPDDFADTCIHEKTSRGMHFYLERPDFVCGKNAIVPKVDLKATASTGTRPIIVCDPSGGKKWIVAPWDGTLRPATSEFLAFLRAHFPSTSSPKPVKTTTTLHEEIFCLYNKGSISWDHLQIMLNGVHISRAEDYDFWLRAIYIVADYYQKHEDVSEEQAIELMETFSKRSDKYKAGANDRTYRDALNRAHTVSVGTLRYWLTHDNPALLQDILDNDIHNLFDKLSNAKAHYDVANLVDKMIGKDYVCVHLDSGKTEHYYFKGHRWTKEPKWSSLWTKLSTIVCSRTLQRSNYWCQVACSTLNDDIQHVAAMKHQNTLSDLAKLLKDHTFKRQIVSEFEKIRAIDAKDFIDKLDANPNLVGFENGVLDLEQNIFRHGVAYDMVTLSTGYNWSDVDDLQVQNNIRDFVDSIMPNQDMTAFMMKRMAYLLTGKKKLQDSNIAFWCGSGANGKGCLKSLILKAFGGYAYEADASLIATRRTDSSKASPELIKTKGRRALFCSEPDIDSKINTAALRNWSGLDTIQARALFGSPEEFVAQFGLTVLMNNKPELSDMDGGITRRLDVVEFKYKFVEHPRKAKPFEKAIDYDLDQTFKDNIAYSQQLMRMLWKIFPSVINCISKPQEVIDASAQYLNDNNKVRAFIDQYLEAVEETVPDKTVMIKSSEMFAAFKRSEHYNGKGTDWFKQQMIQNDVVPEKKTASGVNHNCIVYYNYVIVEPTLMEKDSDDEGVVAKT